jgi:predicted ATPase
MIKVIEVENVRLFEGSGWHFPLSDLTVFCGTNSSGKSTLLKLLLLLRQSMGIFESYESESGKLRFIGSQVDLGSYYTLVSNNDYHRDIVITVIIENTMQAAAANRLRSLSGLSRTPTANMPKIVQYRFKSTFHFYAVPAREISDSEEVGESLEEAPYPELKGIIKYSDYELSVDEQKLLSWKVVPTDGKRDGDPKYSVLIPQNYFETIKGIPKIEVDFGSTEGYVKLGVILDGILPRGLIARLVQEEGDSPIDEQERWMVGPLPPVMFDMVSQLRQELVDIEYIGPLRSPAKRYYLTQPDISPLMDPAGEFLPSILRNIGKYEACYIRPGPQSVPRQEQEPLFNALNVWMHYIRTGQELPEQINDKEIDWDTTRALVEIKVKSVLGDELHALADSGFGYSQLLPIVVRGLMAEEGHTLIVEQPELHLNPAVQLRLAEFLVAMARAGKQILVETHSEHIVNAIRVLTAEDESGDLASICGIYYIDVETGRPVVHELSIRQDGTVPGWPREFFGEAASLTGRLLRAQKRLRRQSGKEV